MMHDIAVAGDAGSLIGSLLVTGLIGGTAHCGMMCGPLVLAQLAARLDQVPAGGWGEARRLAGALLLPYHLGRLVTYALLGALAGGAVGLVRDLTGFRWLAAGLLVLAAVLLLIQALPRRRRPGADNCGPLARLIRPLIAAPTGGRGILLGLVLGLLPCGLVYAALAAAASAGDPLIAAAAMAAFALGTMPVLIAVAAIGQAALARWRGGLARLAPLVLGLNAVWLGLMAWRLVAGGMR